MERKISPVLEIGLLIGIATALVQRFITPISDWIAIPLLVVAIVLIIMGGLKAKDKK